MTLKNLTFAFALGICWFNVFAQNSSTSFSTVKIDGSDYNIECLWNAETILDDTDYIPLQEFVVHDGNIYFSLESGHNQSEMTSLCLAENDSGAWSFSQIAIDWGEFGIPKSINYTYYLAIDSNGTLCYILPVRRRSTTTQTFTIYPLEFISGTPTAVAKYELSMPDGNYTTRKPAISGDVKNGNFFVDCILWYTPTGVAPKPYDDVYTPLCQWTFEKGEEVSRKDYEELTSWQVSLQGLGEGYFLFDNSGNMESRAKFDYTTPTVCRFNGNSLTAVSTLDVDDEYVYDGCANIFRVANQWMIIYPVGEDDEYKYAVAALPEYPYSIGNAVPCWTFKPDTPKEPSVFYEEWVNDKVSRIATDRVSENQTDIYIYALHEVISKYSITTSSQINTAISDIDIRQGSDEYFDLTGRKILCPQSGIYIKRTGNSFQKVILSQN